MKSNSLELKSLTVTRDGALLIPTLNYRLESGEMLIVAGANGSGKSSLLKCIAGLLPSAGGGILLNGLPISDCARDCITYLGHQRGLSLAMSVMDNVAFWGRAYDRYDVVDAALHYFDLDDIADVPVRTLSAGWQQRVALTRLITQPGFLWLLDEPTANLDQQGVNLLHSLLEARLEQGGITLMTTHANVEGEKVKTLDLSNLPIAAEAA